MDSDPIFEKINQILSISLFFIYSFGICTNGFLAFIIYKNNNLRTAGCCGTLIMILALFDTFCEICMFAFNTLQRFIGPISALSCFYLDWIAPWLQPNIQFLMWAISFDRLLSVLVPVGYKYFSMNHRRIYIFTVVGLPAIATLYLPYKWHSYALENSEKILPCSSNVFIDTTALLIITVIQMITNCGMIVNYIAIWLLIKFKLIILTNGTVEHRLHRSLMVLMGIVKICWLPFPIVNNLIIFYFELTQTARSFAISAGIYPNKIAQALNAPILYICSSDYYAAMRRELKKIYTKIHPTNNNQVIVIKFSQHQQRQNSTMTR